MAGFKLTQKKGMVLPRAFVARLLIRRIFFQPGRSVFKGFVNASYVSHAVGFQPFLKCVRPTSDKNADTVLPSRTPAKDAAKMATGFGGKLKRLVEDTIAHASGKKQKGFRGCLGGDTKEFQNVGAGVYESSVGSRRVLNISHGYRHANLQDIDTILRPRKFLHCTCQNPGLASRKLRAFLIHTGLIGDNFEEKRDVTGGAF